MYTIKPAELRIGNLVYLELGLPVLNVHAMKGQDIADYSNGRITIGAVKPIPISAEWLANFEFELFPWGWVKKSSQDFGVRLHVRGFHYDVSGNYPVQLHSIHQLQNLYFALTCEELSLEGKLSNGRKANS